MSIWILGQERFGNEINFRNSSLATASNVAGLSYWNELMLDQLQYMGSERDSRVPPAAHAYFPKVESSNLSNEITSALGKVCTVEMQLKWQTFQCQWIFDCGFYLKNTDDLWPYSRGFTSSMPHSCFTWSPLIIKSMQHYVVSGKSKILQSAYLSLVLFTKLY